MNRNNQQHESKAFDAVHNSSTGIHTLSSQNTERLATKTPTPCQSLILHARKSEILAQIGSGQLLAVAKNRRCGLIIYKRFHAEFAGPGAAVGGFLDVDCQQIVPVGDLALVYPESHQERQKAFSIRRHWIRLIEQLTQNAAPMQRAQTVLTQFEHYFDPQTVSQISDEAFARLVGVLPQTVATVRRTASQLSAPVMA
ncbi:hypothetical protein [Kamptonema formosum]|uniref:hypothetical protein n=1 Tax=Kamptonema formosum TaxID=331992 RepID=UPI00034D682D|nr:hypothetical protein [Oscillatoria sp. PCC 10802]